MNNLYIGIMSGTSIDAIDCILVNFPSSNSSKIKKLEIIDSYSIDIPEQIQQLLFSLNVPQKNEIELMLRMDVAMGNLIADACNELINISKVTREQVQAIGSHGQTIRHYPKGEFKTSLQIGDPNIIAEKTSIKTVADFRRRDIAAGGEGAPLVPLFHQEIFYNQYESRCVVNIGGISNITCLSKDKKEPVIGFDTGPGNTLIDIYCQKHFNLPYDAEGKIASSGQLNHDLLQLFLSEPYFTQSFPKSTGRDYFGHSWLKDKLNIFNQNNSFLPSTHDILSTLTELTATTIIKNIKQSLPNVGKILVCGGGAKNKYMMSRIMDLAGTTKVSTTDESGYESQHIECLAFAWLAKQTIHGLTGNLTSVTGAKKPVILGAIYS